MSLHLGKHDSLPQVSALQQLSNPADGSKPDAGKAHTMSGSWPNLIHVASRNCEFLRENDLSSCLGQGCGREVQILNN